MKEQMDRVWVHVYGIWGYRWYALAVAWLVAGTGWALALQVPNQYEASAQVHVDTDSMLKPLMRGMVIESNIERRVDLMTRTLFSRPNLEEIARQTDLDLTATSQQDLDRVVSDLQRRLRLSGTGRNNLYRISYRGDDAVLARDVVQAAVNLLIEESIRGSRDDSESATRFLDRKLAEYAKRLEAAEQQRIEFRREHADVLSGSGGDYYRRLEQRSAELEEARFQHKLSQSRERELEAQLDGEMPVFGIMSDAGSARSNVATPELDRRIERLDDQLEELLLRYTEAHPRVGSLRNQLERHSREREDERARLAANQDEAPLAGGSGLDRNPVHQEIRTALARARADVATATSRVGHIEEQIAALRSSVDTVPEIESRFAELLREQEMIRITHDDLLRRRQTAEISGEVERSENQIEFRVIEPPRIPAVPSAPNRPALITASLGASVAGFVALGLLLTLMWPTFHGRLALRDALNLPVLGVIERVRTPPARRRWWLGLTLFSAAALGLLVAYAAVMAIAELYF